METFASCPALLLPSKGKRSVRRLQEWRFSSPRRHGFDRLDIAVSHNESAVEIIYRGANVAGQKVEHFADLRRGRTLLQRNGKMFLAG